MESERQDQTVKILNDVIQCFPFMVVLMTDRYGFKVSQGSESHADDRDPLSLHQRKSWTGLVELILESGPLNKITGNMWNTIVLYRSDICRENDMPYNDDGTFEHASDAIRQGRLLQKMRDSVNVSFQKIANSSPVIVSTIEREVMKMLKKFCPARQELEPMTDDWRHDYLEHDLASRVTASCIQPTVEMIDVAINRMTMRCPPFPLCVTAEDGFGLSSTVSFWKHRHSQATKVDFEFFHSFGATRASLDLDSMFLRLLGRMKLHLGIAKSMPNPAMPLAGKVVRWLNAASSASYTILIVLDGAHKALQGLHAATSWIPSYLPTGVKIVFSCPPYLIRSIACKYSHIECNISVPGSTMSVLHQFTQFCRPFPIQEVFLSSTMQACEGKGPLFTAISLGLLDVDFFHWEFSLEQVSQCQTVLELCTRLYPSFLLSCDGRPFICRESFALLAVSLQGVRQEDLLTLLQPYRPHFNELLHNSIAIKIIEVRNGIWFWASTVTSSVLLQCLSLTQNELYNAAITLARYRLQNPKGVNCADIYEACSLYEEYVEPTMLAETLKRRNALLAIRESYITVALLSKWLVILEEMSSKKHTAEVIVEHVISSLHVKIDLSVRVEVYSICCSLFKDLQRLNLAMSVGSRAMSLANDLPSSRYATYVSTVMMFAEIHELRKDYLTGLRLLHSLDVEKTESGQGFELQSMKMRLAVSSGCHAELLSTATSIISIEKNRVTECLGNDIIDLTIGSIATQSSVGGMVPVADALLDAQANFKTKKPSATILYCVYCCMLARLCENRYTEMCELYEHMDSKYRLCSKDHAFPIKMLYAIAHILAGRYHRAVTICNEVFESCVKVLGSDINAFQLQLSAILAHALCSCGRYQESSDCLMNCISKIGRIKGYGHLDLLPLIDEAARTAQLSQDCKTAHQWRQCAASILEDAKAHGTSKFALNRLCMIVCESLNAADFKSELSSLLLETQRINDTFVHKMGWEHEIVYSAQVVIALLELRSNRLTGCIDRCRHLNAKLAKWIKAKSSASHLMTLCNILNAQAHELQGYYEMGFKVRL
jgi:type II secretory pathway predicted ATPase ExeA